VLESLDKFAEKISFSKVLILNFDEKYLEKYIIIANMLRKNNISTEIFLDSSVKIAKQFDYANAKNIIFALIIGENEIQNKTVNIKNLLDGKQEEINEERLEEYLSNFLSL
jgi:histidyl-tRNA synthetase